MRPGVPQGAVTGTLSWVLAVTGVGDALRDSTASPSRQPGRGALASW